MFCVRISRWGFEPVDVAAEIRDVELSSLVFSERGDGQLRLEEILLGYPRHWHGDPGIEPYWRDILLCA